MNYTFEVEINDFANCWYLHVNDAKCSYKIELGRKYKNYKEIIKLKKEVKKGANKNDLFKRSRKYVPSCKRS